MSLAIISLSLARGPLLVSRSIQVLEPPLEPGRGGALQWSSVGSESSSYDNKLYIWHIFNEIVEIQDLYMNKDNLIFSFI